MYTDKPKTLRTAMDNLIQNIAEEKIDIALVQEPYH
jgi:hypothetical protein